MITENRGDKRIILVSVAAIFTLLLYLAGVSNSLKHSVDSAEFVGLAYSLADGYDYQFNGRVGFFPPFTSTVLAGVIWLCRLVTLGDSTVAGMKIAQVGWAALYAIGSWRLARRYLEKRWAQLVGLLVGVNLFVLQHCMFIMTDMLFCCLSIWALVLLDDDRRVWRWIAGACLMALAMLTRVIGVTLVLGVFFWLIFGRVESLGFRSRFRRWLLTPVLSVMPLLGWQLYFADSERGYYNWASGETGSGNVFEIMWERFLEVAPIVPVRSVQALMNIEQIDLCGPGLRLPLYFTAILFAVLVIGWLCLFIRRRDLVCWYVFFYIGIMSVVADQGPRYFLPLVGLFLIYGIVGVRWLIAAARRVGVFGWLMKLFVGVGLVGLTLPLVQYLWRHRVAPGGVEMLRCGYVYCGLAGVLVALWVLWACKERLRAATGKAALVFTLSVYMALGWMYCGAYAALEQGVVKSRGPMLCGYEHYYKAGLWLGRQEHITEPVLCASRSIVHLASGKITRSPAKDAAETLVLMREGKYGCVLLMKQADVPMPGEDVVVEEVVHSSSNAFREVVSGSENGLSYWIYVIEN